MIILRRLLYLDALLQAVLGALLAAVPRSVAGTFFAQPVDAADDPFLRTLGAMLFVLALYMVLVAHRIEDLWWWSWGFVLMMVGGALIATTHVLFGLPEGASPVLWWLIAAVGWGFAFGLLWGLARAGLEKPAL